MKIEPQQLKAFLLDAKLVTEEQLEKAEKIAKKLIKNWAILWFPRGLYPRKSL